METLPQTNPAPATKRSVLDWIKLSVNLAVLLAATGIIKGKVGDTINKTAPVVGPIVNGL